MPIKWKYGSNLYADTCYARLRLGPNVAPGTIIAQAGELRKKLAAGVKLEIAGRALDEHDIAEAQKKLLDEPSRTHELLLVHPEPASEAKRIAATCEQLRKAAEPSDERTPLPLVVPEAIFWFVPEPGPEAAELPPWNAFGFAEPGGPEDREDDIVFDR
jgi:hypothetical protein